jgi:DNA-binding MarR family transcriptional regulator
MCIDDDGTITPFASGWDVMFESRRVQHRFEVAMDQALEGIGISYAQYRALEALLAGGDLHVSELARRLRVTRQSASDTVAKLQWSDLVELEREPHATYVLVTPHGRKRLEMGRRFTHDLGAAIEEALTQPGCGRLVSLLRKADLAVSPPHRPTWWLGRA